MSDDIRAQGCTVSVWDATISPDAYVVIDGIQSISGPTGSATVIDATDLSSTAKEKLIGLKDWGNFTLGMKYDPEDAKHSQFRSDLGSASSRNYKITFSDTSPATTWTFAAYVTGFNVQASVDALLTVDVTLEISGDVVQP